MEAQENNNSADTSQQTESKKSTKTKTELSRLERVANGQKESIYKKVEGKTSSEKDALKFKSKKFKNYQAVIDFFAIFSDDTIPQLDLSAYITSFEIFYVYTDLVFPVVKIKLLLSRNLLEKITSDFKQIKFRLNVDQIKQLKEPLEQKELAQDTVYENYINNVILVPNDMSRAKYEELDFLEDDNETQARFDYPLELELFKKEHLEINKKIFNTSFTYENTESKLAEEENFEIKEKQTDSKKAYTYAEDDKKTENMDNARVVWNFLMSKLTSKNSDKNSIIAAAFMGNFYLQSAFKPNKVDETFKASFNFTDESYTDAVVNKKYKKEQFTTDNAGYGLVQWAYSVRKEGLYNFAKSKKVRIDDIKMQLEYFWSEIKNTLLLRDIKACTKIKAASDLIIQYFQPKDQSANAKEKAADYGELFYEKFKNSEKINIDEAIKMANEAALKASVSALTTAVNNTLTTVIVDNTKIEETTTTETVKEETTAKKKTRKKKNKKEKNVIKTKTKITVKDVINKLKSKIKQEIIFYEPDNKTEYDQIVLIGSNFTQSIYYLQNVYGIYLSGVLIFFDFERGYIIPRSDNHEIEMDSIPEYKENIIYVGKSASEPFFHGVKISKKDKLNHILSMKANNFNFNDISTKELYGEDIKIRRNSTKDELTSLMNQENLEYIENNEEKGTNSYNNIMKERLYYSKFDNPYISTEMLYHNAAHLRFIVHLAYVKLNILKMPFTYYVTFFDESLDKSYSGKYKLSTMIISCTRYSQKVFDVYASLEMFKSKLTDEDLIKLLNGEKDEEKKEEKYFYYKVKKASTTLYKLAKKFYGNGELWTKVYEDNKDIIGSDPTKVLKGMELRIYAQSNEKDTQYFEENDLENVEVDENMSWQVKKLSPLELYKYSDLNLQHQIDKYIKDAEKTSELWQSHCKKALKVINDGEKDYFYEVQDSDDCFYKNSLLKTWDDKEISLSKCGSFLFSISTAISRMYKNVFTLREMEEHLGNVFYADGTMKISKECPDQFKGGVNLIKTVLDSCNAYYTNVEQITAEEIKWDLIDSESAVYILWNSKDMDSYSEKLCGTWSNWSVLVDCKPATEKAYVLCNSPHIIDFSEIKKSSVIIEIKSI